MQGACEAGQAWHRLRTLYLGGRQGRRWRDYVCLMRIASFPVNRE